MVNCNKCGSRLSSDSIFCPVCGNQVTAPLAAQELPLAAKTKTEEGLALPGAPQPRKPKPARSVILLPLLVIIIIIAIAAVFFVLNLSKSSCAENWSCGNWSACANSLKTRNCTDMRSCGTESSKPLTSMTCSGTTNGTNNQTPPQLCSGLNSKCLSTTDCCSGYCVHGFCRGNRTFCGDVYCDPTENCSNCQHDCGNCPASRELKQNVVTNSLGYAKENEFKEAGYVIVRYFKTADCNFCVSPIDIESQLRSLARDFKDILVLIIIDTDEYPEEANKYARVGGNIYVPFIRVEGYKNGVHGYDTLYGYPLGLKLGDNDITEDIALLVCKHSDYCKFEKGKITRTTP